MQPQKIQVGDTVQLTASVLFGLHEQNKAAYDLLMETKRTGGKVVDVSDEHISVDVGQDTPIVLELDATSRDVALQLVQRGEHAEETKDVSPPKEDPRQPGRQPSPSAGFIDFANAGIPIMQVLRGAAPGMPGIFQQQQPVEQAVPQNVRLSQWVILQFIGLKQYGIVQDLNRNDDATAGRPDPTGENWNKKELRAVQVELTAPEEGLYNSALSVIKSWIVGPVAKSTHPEMVTELPEPAHAQVSEELLDISDELLDISPADSSDPADPDTE